MSENAQPSHVAGPDDPIAGTYDTIRTLGQGGMGIVALVRDRLTARQYAVKRIRNDQLDSAMPRRDFLRELLTWSETPEHPFIAQFRFFRSLKDEVLLFSEYIDAGSLHDWIAEGRIHSIEQILEIAIRAAYGIQAAHDCTIIHQDIKPKNILMSQDAVPHITDFGLARIGGRIRAAKRDVEPDAMGDTEPVHPPSTVTTAVSSSGFTPAYCSPEQAEGFVVTPRSDQWSWGVTVLEMFNGERMSDWGFLAGQSLSHLINNGPSKGGVPRIPDDVAGVLRRCFAMNQRERFPSIVEAAGQLNEILRKMTGGTGIPQPAIASPIATKNHRKAPNGLEWRDPNEFLAECPPALRDLLQPERPSYRNARSCAIADLIHYEEIQTELPRRCPQDPELIMKIDTDVLDEITQILWTLGDTGGALAACDRAIARRSDPACATIPGNLNALAANHGIRGTILCLARQFQSAIPALDQTASLWETLAAESRSPDDLSRFAMTLMHRANATKMLGQVEPSIAFYDRSNALFEQALDQKPDFEIRRRQSYCLMNRANTMRMLGRFDDAMTGYLDAARMLDACPEDLESHIREDRALISLNRAGTLWSMQHFEESIAEFDRAIAIYQSIDPGETDYPIQMDRALAIANKANALASLNRPAESIALYETVIRIRSHWLHEEGRREAAESLATAYLNMAYINDQMNEPDRCLDALDRSIGILEPLIRIETRITLKQVLLLCYCHQFRILFNLERFSASASVMQKTEHLIPLLRGILPSSQLDIEMAQITLMQFIAQSHGVPVRFSRADADQALALLESNLTEETPTDVREAYERLVKLYKNC